MIPWAVLWRSDLEWLAHLVGIIGFGLMLLSMLYSLRKRKWFIRRGKMRRWLWFHHLLGLTGGLMALVHTLGNSLGRPMIIILVLVMASSGIYFIEQRARRPLIEATAELGRVRKERSRLDGVYRQIYSWGQAGTQQGIDAYNALLVQIETVRTQEGRLEGVRSEMPNLAWWRYIHNVGTMSLIGVLLVHIWSKLYFAWGGL